MMFHYRNRMITIAIMVLGLTFVIGAPVSAQIELVLDNAAVEWTGANSILFSGTITNNFSFDLYLNGSFGTIDSPLAIDDSAFTSFFVTDNPRNIIKPGQSIVNALFSVAMPDDLNPGFYTGEYLILGGADEFSVTEFTSASFSISAVAPEPASGTLVMGLLPFLGVGIFRNRRRCRVNPNISG